MRTLSVIIVLLSLVLSVGHAAAQEAQRRENVDYYFALFTKFKPGASREAREIIYTHFWPTDQEIGQEVIPFDVLTGDWDHVVFFKMDGGPADLGWETSPSDLKWDAALAKKLGGQEAMETVVTRFQELVDREQTFIVARPRKPE